jgi:peptide-methionine (S)-S-oxide reductase
MTAQPIQSGGALPAGDDDTELPALIAAIPEGWSRARIDGATWGLTRTTRAGGKVVSIDAERLGSADGLGANVWLTTRGPVLRPCEVAEDRVLEFLRAAADAASS